MQFDSVVQGEIQKCERPPEDDSIGIQSLHDYVIYVPFPYDCNKEKLRNVDRLPKTISVVVHTIAELITNKYNEINFANVKNKLDVQHIISKISLNVLSLAINHSYFNYISPGFNYIVPLSARSVSSCIT